MPKLNPFPAPRFSRRHWLACLAATGLTACGGVPLRSLPRLGQLSGQLLDTDPAQVMMAVQVDKGLAPSPDARAWLHIRLTPRVAGAFEPIDARLPLVLDQTSRGAAYGLDPAPAGRRWLVYSLPAPTQAELKRAQDTVRLARQQPGYQRGGTLSLGLAQDELAQVPPGLAHTPWQTWLQVSRKDGFFLLWEGTPDQLLRAAKSARQANAPR